MTLSVSCRNHDPGLAHACRGISVLLFQVRPFGGAGPPTFSLPESVVGPFRPPFVLVEQYQAELRRTVAWEIESYASQAAY
jgi:hypothetical protein